MAGIGFQLKRIFSKGLLGKIQGSLYSMIISSGPWLVTIITIAVVSYFARLILSEKETMILKAVVSYTFAYTLIAFGFIEMPLTRYLADKHYQQDFKSYSSVFLSTTLFFLFVSTLTGYLFYSAFSFSLTIKILCIGFLFFIFMIWASMLFLSATKQFIQIVIGFLLGGMVAITIAFVADKTSTMETYMIAFTCGHGVIAFWLAGVLFSNFGFPDKLYLDFLAYFPRFWPLMVSGFCYYMGIWIDKFIFWTGETGEHVLSLFYTNRYYDTAIFFAYISIIPTLAIFLVKIETSFFVAYTNYFSLIHQKSSLPVIQSAVKDMVKVLRTNLSLILRWQTFISGVALYFANEIITLLHLPSMMLIIFRYGIIGAFIQVLFLTGNIILMYFDARKEVMTINLTFFLLQFYGAFLTKEMGYAYHGMGYVIASLITLILTVFFLNRRLSLVNYYTFMSQPYSS